MTAELESYFDRLWPILRSITGEGVRQTFDILGEICDLKVHEVPSGTQVLDWEVPEEWSCTEAYIITPSGQKICDMKENNLHILNYSIGFEGTVSLEELNDHLYSLPDSPDAIPYITSYYARKWGFCITHRQREELVEGDYQVVIKAKHFKGNLTWGEYVIPGRSKQEVLFSTYVCHPSMANNELSGPLVQSFLARSIADRIPNPFYTYRFVFVPETIGSITFLSSNGKHLMDNLKAGFVLSCLGDHGQYTYKKPRKENSLTEKVLEYYLKSTQTPFSSIAFCPQPGSDERQYCSPGFNLPMATFMRTMFTRYPEYHTSLDNKQIISFENLEETVSDLTNVVGVLEKNRVYLNKLPFGEPQLGKRGLYPTQGDTKAKSDRLTAQMWLLNYADGDHDLIDIANLSGFSLELLSNIAQECKEKSVIEELV